MRMSYEQGWEPAGADEPNIVSVKIVPGDTPQEVVEKILDQV